MPIIAHFAVLFLVTYDFLPWYAALVIPLLYIVIITPPTFGVCVKPTLAELVISLGERWREPTNLARYMHRHWDAIANAGTAYIHQRYCVMLFVMQAMIGSTLVWNGNRTILGTVILFEALVLAVTAHQVNKPYRTYLSFRARKSQDQVVKGEWTLAVTALIAYGELYPQNTMAAYIAKGI